MATRAPSPGRLAFMPEGTMDSIQERFKAGAEGCVVVRAAEPAFVAKLHILYPTGGAGQSREFIGDLADVLADKSLEDRGKIKFLLLDQLLLLCAFLAEMQLFLLT